ncbi:MAG: methyltransferase domain-containing protein [Verrucomicrobia bacterium]|nr:methyltransferase domain-containing protein [Verrucomicrobiota bacterium]MBU1908768.1 methyltransferase domain-containing protein [Verrucomicrobiota bacterium]
MNLHQQSVRARFSAAADTYATRAAVQSAVADRLIDMLPAPGTVRRLLEVGCGTGVLTRRLAGRYPGAVLEAIDHSGRMVETARRETGMSGDIAWHAADILSFESNTPYDLIASNCALHWIQPLEAGARKLCALLAEGGTLAFSIMLDGTLGELRESRLRVAPLKPPLGRLPALSEVIRAVEAAGGRIASHREETLQAHHESAAAFLRHIHAMGLTGGLVSRSQWPLNRGEVERLMADYDRHHRGGDGVVATYRVGYVRAHRAA